MGISIFGDVFYSSQLFVERTAEFLITPEGFLLNHFAILGLVVTLLSITTALTKDVRNDLIRRYYLFKPSLFLFAGYLFVSFMIVFSLHYFESSHLNFFSYLLLAISFLYTLYFIFYFLKELNRLSLYEKIFRKFQREILREQNGRRSKSDMKYSRSDYESINDLVKNITYVGTSSDDYSEEFTVLKNIINFALENNRADIIDDLFTGRKDILRVRSVAFREGLISMLYELRFQENTTPAHLAFYQRILYNLVSVMFTETSTFDYKLNTSGVYLKEFIEIRFVDQFKSSSDKSWLESYSHLMSSTVDHLYRLCKLILDLQLDDKTKQLYLESQLGELNKCLEYFRNTDKSEYGADYYALLYKERKTEKEKQRLALVEYKSALVADKLLTLQKRKVDLFFKILHSIDVGKLPKSYFQIALKLYRSRGFDDVFYSFDFSEHLNFMSYDWFEGGAQAVSGFDYNKYRVVMSFYKYVTTKAIDITQYSKEIFIEDKDFQNAINSAEQETMSRYFYFDSSLLKKFKSEAQKEVKKKLEWIKKEESNYIINTRIKKEYVDKFKEDCKSAWNEEQEPLKQFIQFKIARKTEEKIGLFGQHLLFPKEWFLDSFNKNVSLSRSSGTDFGRTQGRSKFNACVEKIDSSYNERTDSTIIVKDFHDDVLSILPKGEYFVLYNSDFDIYSIPKLQWVRKGGIVAELQLQESTVYFLPTTYTQTVLVERNAFSLEQYTHFINDDPTDLYVEVREITDSAEIKKLIESKTNELNTENDVREKVIVRVLESFTIKRNDSENINIFLRRLKK